MTCNFCPDRSDGFIRMTLINIYTIYTYVLKGMSAAAN